MSDYFGETKVQNWEETETEEATMLFIVIEKIILSDHLSPVATSSVQRMHDIMVKSSFGLVSTMFTVFLLHSLSFLLGRV